jgi:hypothetical protein
MKTGKAENAIINAAADKNDTLLNMAKLLSMDQS